MKEHWLEIPNFEGLYKVSNTGKIIALPKLKHTPHGALFMSQEKNMKQSKLLNNYLIVTLSKNKVQKRTLVHRLVASLFIENSFKLKEINHIDGNKSNNCASNLEWITHSDNMKHAIKLGLIPKNRKRASHKNVMP